MFWIPMALLAVSAATASNSDPFRFVLPHLHHSVVAQYDQCQLCLDRWQRPNVSERLAAVYLYVTGDKAPDACSIRLLLSNLEPATATDIFVFVTAASHVKMTLLLQEALGSRASRVCVVSISEQQWQHHRMIAQPYTLGANQNFPAKEGNFNKDYINMGMWRLLVPYHIMSALGYPYFLQVDSDLYVTESFKTNIVSHMRSHNMTFATHCLTKDADWVVQGLPELAAFYLASNGLKAGSSLWKHVRPGDITGLYSSGNETTGFDRSVLYGNFFIMSTDLYMQSKVHDWFVLCMASGGMERHRWVDQAVLSFAWLLFSMENELWEIPGDFRWAHTKDRIALCSKQPTW